MDAKTGPDKGSKLKTRVASYALRLPASIKAEAEKLAKEDGVSLNQFVATAVAEKVSALRTVSYFVPYKARAVLRAFDRIMGRKGGEAVREDDALPDETQVG